jgi:hypothetical protein
MLRSSVSFQVVGDCPATALSIQLAVELNSAVTHKQARSTKAKTLGAHASSVLPPATNKSKVANKARKAPSPASALPHRLTFNRSAGTAVTPLLISGPSPDGVSNRSLSLAPDLTVIRDNRTAVLRLHNSRQHKRTEGELRRCVNGSPMLIVGFNARPCSPSNLLSTSVLPVFITGLCAGQRPHQRASAVLMLHNSANR